MNLTWREKIANLEIQRNRLPFMADKIEMDRAHSQNGTRSPAKAAFILPAEDGTANSW